MTKIFQKGKFWADLTVTMHVKKKISVMDAAREIGISRSTMNRVKNNEDVTIETFAKICKWMDMNPGMYFDLDS